MRYFVNSMFSVSDMFLSASQWEWAFYKVDFPSDKRFFFHITTKKKNDTYRNLILTDLINQSAIQSIWWEHIFQMFFFSVNTHFLVMKPMNQEGKRPLLTISGTWVSKNHFDANSLSLPSVTSAAGSPVGSLCSILVWSWSKQRRQRVQTTSIIFPVYAGSQYFNSLICLFSRRCQPGAECTSVFSSKWKAAAAGSSSCRCFPCL